MPSLSSIPVVVAVAGALIAYATYRRSKRHTVHDLRSEVRAEQKSLRATAEALPAQVELAKRSFATAADATGNTEGLQQRLRELDLDLSEAERLRSQSAAADSDYDELSDMAVEIKLVEVLALSLRASMLADKYRTSISTQETDRPMQETDREILAEDAEVLLVEAAQYSHDSRSSIRESVV
jgi:hypothetical protein